MSAGQRILLRVTSALLALAIIAGASLLIGQVVVGIGGGGDFIVPTENWYGTLRRTPWSDASVVYTGIALVISGLLLLTVVLSTRPRVFALARPDDGVEVVIPPRAVAQMLRRHAEAVAGVGAASAEVGRDLARISVTVPVASPERVERDLTQALAHGLKLIPWTRVPRLEIEVVGPRVSPPTTPLDRVPDGSR